MADHGASQTLDKWSQLVEDASSDESLRRRLIENPARVLEEHGMKVRPGVEVRVVENTDKVAYLTLPARPVEGDLTMDQLDRVVGGRKATGTSTPYLVYTMEQVFVTSVSSSK